MLRASFDDVQAAACLDLPIQSRMPLNCPGRLVYSTLIKDLSDPKDTLVVTGYSGLEQLIKLITSRSDKAQPLRIILGTEPGASKNTRFTLKRQNFSSEIKAYWLERGISLFYSGHILKCIEAIKGERVLVRYPHAGFRLHAKMYCSQDGATVGSSNFTLPGLEFQHEANVRFDPSEDRFQEVWKVAEYFWSRGDDASEELIELLSQLLKFVSWKEALSRACAELLESEWANHYLHSLREFLPVKLWPSQRQAIGQALYLLETVGAVLIADAAGSGKTRLGAHLLRAIYDRNWSTAQAHKGPLLLICPPLISKAWESEIAFCGFNAKIISQGMLSRLSDKQYSTLGVQLATAQLMAVDEAHNFLNHASKRTRHLKHNLADQVVLFTATPINRHKTDLLRLIDILGADNLDDAILSVLEGLSRKGRVASLMSGKELRSLRDGIASFTVRRTKVQLNALVEQNPTAYQLPNGKVCRYPSQRSSVYALDESLLDRKLARRIRRLALSLYGVSYFQSPMRVPEGDEKSPEQYLFYRLHSARSLALYNVMSSLRSSRVALYRHIEGEKAACARMGLAWHPSAKKDDEIGNMLYRIKRLEGRVPENYLGIPLPIWLSDPLEHRKACKHDIQIYEKIRELLKLISGCRDQCKVDHIAGLLAKHKQIIAFDHYPISLAFFAKLLNKKISKKKDATVLVGVGGQRKKHELIQHLLDPQGESKGLLIVLCSDALSEGVNLQRASTLTHLDMPSVVRVAEQRVGRIDRMDSPHDEIEVWWPQDAPEFALRTDELFFHRFNEVERLLGGNLILPPEILAKRPKIVTPSLMARKVRRRQALSWDGIEDAFAPVRSLVSGRMALVSAKMYRSYKSESARVLSRVSIVAASEPWVFLCLAGEKKRAPRWVLLVEDKEKPIIQLREIVGELRKRLTADSHTLEPSEEAMAKLQVFVSALEKMDVMLLPNLKQRALRQLEWAVNTWLKNSAWIKKEDQCEQIRQLQALLCGDDRGHVPNWSQLADIWLELVRPRRFNHVNNIKNRKSFFRLRDLEPDLMANPIEVEVLLQKLEGINLRRPWEERIVACILGYGADTESPVNL